MTRWQPLESNPEYQKHKEEEAAKLAAEPQKISEKVFYMKQTIRNACGTMALFHSIANCQEEIGLQEGPLKKFLDEAAPMSPAERSQLFEDAEELATIHKRIAQQGQTEAPPADAELNHHFIALVHKDGILYELDGNKGGPISHGPTSPETLLEDAAVVCNKFMQRDPEDLHFTVMALAAAAS